MAVWADFLVDIKAHPDVGASFLTRVGPDGPEQRLVEDFLALKTVELEKGQRLTVFLEPIRQGAYPDVAAIFWRDTPRRDLLDYRWKLAASDFEWLASIWRGGITTIDEFKQVKSRAAPIARRLERAGVLDIEDGRLVLRPEEVCLVERVILVEAKLSCTKSLFQQAYLNSLGGLESWALTVSCPRAKKREQFQRVGIGMASLKGGVLKEMVQPKMQERNHAMWGEKPTGVFGVSRWLARVNEWLVRL